MRDLDETIRSFDLESYLAVHFEDIRKVTSSSDEQRICCFNCTDTKHHMYINTVKKRWICFKCGYGDTRQFPGTGWLPRFMSDIEGHPDQGQISGLNGLLIGMAGERNIEALCLMGEFPLYLAHETSYPKGSRSVLEVLSAMIEADLDFGRLERWIQRTDVEIDKVYKKIPDELRQQIDKIKLTRQTKPSSLTDEEKEEFFKEVEDFLRGSEQGGESSV